MKIAILLSFTALLGVSIALDITKLEIQDIAAGNGIPTGVTSLVKDLITFYEELTKSTAYADDSSGASTESVFGSGEVGKNGKVTTRMLQDIAQIEAAFKAKVSPSYDGMSDRKLWKELKKKQKHLATLKVQLQHLLNAKQEKLNKLRGKPLNHKIPSQDLSNTILSYIEEVVNYEPTNPNL